MIAEFEYSHNRPPTVSCELPFPLGPVAICAIKEGDRNPWGNPLTFRRIGKPMPAYRVAKVAPRLLLAERADGTETIGRFVQS